MGKKRKRALKHFLIAVAFVYVFLVVLGLVIPSNKYVPKFSPGTCTDSDGGIYPSTFGSVNSDNYNYDNLVLDDYCFNSTRVVEIGCSENYTYSYRTYDCVSGCSNGACSVTRDSYVLSANFSYNGSDNIVEISKNFGGTWKNICSNKTVGDSCDLGNLNLSIDDIFVSENDSWGNFSFGNLGKPFRVIYDDLNNEIILPVGSDLPSKEYSFNIFDKDGGWYEGPIQVVNISWENNVTKIVYGDVLKYKNHNFVFEVVGNYTQIRVPVSDGAVTIPVLYGNGTDFLGIGENSSNLFVTSDANNLFYNLSAGDKEFSVSLSGGGFVNIDGEGSAICDAVVIANLSSCVEGEKIESYYSSNDSCVNSVPANATYSRCDYDSNNIIGFVSDVDSNFPITIYEGGDELNLSLVHNGTKSIEIDEDSDVRVSFDYDYDSKPLDLTEIFLEKQSSNGAFGYLIVNGLDGENKTFYIDKIMNNSNSVCVEDGEINSIDSISNGCSGSEEYIVDCDGGNYSGFTCVEVAGDYMVTGLENSAVKEFENTPEIGSNESCVSNWACGDWGDCVSGVKTRVCTDLNNCGDSSVNPGESQSCVVAQQTSSSDQGNTTVEDNSQASQDSGTYFWIIVAVLILAIVVVIIMIILSLRNKSLEKNFGQVS